VANIDPMDFAQLMDSISRGLELLGVTVILVGIAAGAVMAVRMTVRSGRAGVYALVRRYFGQSILLGLEILVAADLIRTIAVEPTISSVLVLGVIVLIRTFLSFSLSVEIYGHLPWRGRGEAKDAEALEG
jgi:uncharacterized membrane protein